MVRTKSVKTSRKDQQAQFAPRYTLRCGKRCGKKCDKDSRFAAAMKRDENQNVEYKEPWHEKYLEWICGYAIEFFTEGGNSL